MGYTFFMQRVKTAIAGILLIGFGFGLIQTPLSFAACRRAQEMKACCCCSSTHSKSDCPVLKKIVASPLAVLPAQPKISFVAFAQPLQGSMTCPAGFSRHGVLVRDLSPPHGLAASPASLRAPPSLA